MTPLNAGTLGRITTALAVAAIALTSQAAEGPAGLTERPAMGMQHKMDKLHQDLGLDKKQEALFQAAREAGRNAMRDAMQARRASRDRMKAALEGPNPDLRALTAQMDKERDEQMQKHRQVREAWLNFYDALNPAQKEKARHFIVGQMDHRMEGHGRRSMHRDRGPGDARNPGMPPAAR